MRKITFLFLFLCTYACSFAQFTWTWLHGDALTPGAVNFGKLGIADSPNYPGSRIGQKTWIDKSGDTWLFGGLGFNDIWKYAAATDKWTWINGTKFPTDPPVYGKKGVASALNRISTNNYSAIWTDGNGNLWVYGGQYDPFCDVAALLVESTNDLWKYAIATNQWTWMGGDTSYIGHRVIAHQGLYAKKGVASAVNKPPSKHHAMNWMDRQGNLWLFGGSENGSVNNGSLNDKSLLKNDLWKYAPATGFWTWMSGDSTNYYQLAGSSYSNYGVKGVESATNTPGDRTAGTSWTDSSGNFWLLGGYGVARSLSSSFPGVNPPANPQGLLNDLWRFSPGSNQWTWMGGDTITSAPGKYISSQARPGGRTAATSWTDKQGDLWLRSGSVDDSTSYNDFWKYSISNNQWTWMGGDTTLRKYRPLPVEKNVFLPGISPAPDPATVIEKDNETLIFSLKGDQRWLYNKLTDQWAFINGQIVPKYSTTDLINGTTGMIDSAGIPHTRSYASTWKDKTDNLWMFGGQRARTGMANLYDLWMYDTRQKTWNQKRSGEGTASYNYGTAGQPSDSARPTNRSAAYTFVDQSGILWLFGGVVNPYYNLLNDLWSFNPLTNQWTWYGGDASTSSAVYQATPSRPAWPGAMGKGNAWTDTAGNFWIFGGQSNNNINNEVWMFNPQTKIWTFIGGDKVSNPPPVYPPPILTGRSGATSWTDMAGNFCLFGGATYNRVYSGQYGELREILNNDLFKYSPATKVWTSIKGDQTVNSRGSYGTKGVSSMNSVPRSRIDGIGWTDSTGNLYLFGGSRDTIKPCTFTTTEQFNDLWKYSIATNQWTWLAGDSVGNAPGNYGAYGVPSTENQPGARSTSAIWQNGTGNAWIFSGYGYAQSGARALNDMMLFSTAAPYTLPVNLTSFTASRQDALVSLQWITAQEFNSRSFSVEHSADGLNFTAIGNVAASGNTLSPSWYSFRDNHPLEGSNYYRLKQIDLDNNFMYSKIVKVDFGVEKSQFVIVSNPVINDLTINLDLATAEILTLRITDANGKLIASQSYPGSRGKNNINIGVSHLSAGNYILNIKSRTISVGKKFVKL